LQHPHHHAAAAQLTPDRDEVSLADLYRSLFEVTPATTAEQIRESYRLRYQVYCVENDFLDPAENPGGLETDACDAHSLHALLVHRPTGMVAGTIRLVLPRPGAAAGSLPLHAVCRDPRLALPGFLPLASTAELSRFAISKQFRRRAGDRLYGGVHEADPGDCRRIIPHMTLGLMAIALKMVEAKGIDHVCAVMEPALLRLLARLGIHFTAIGPVVEYHGLRQPCYSRVDTLLARLERERPDVWAFLTDREEPRPLRNDVRPRMSRFLPEAVDA
jgi:N-acyl amino acid synthase of PEP-CTERM/exosortase system